MAEDVLVASFHSPYRYGEVRLWYCPQGDEYRCSYEIVEGCAKLGAQVCVPAALYDDVSAMILDAMDIASTQLERRS